MEAKTKLWDKQMKKTYEKIKKQNGEAFAKAILHFDNGIFEIPDIVAIVRHAGNEAEPLLNYLASLKEVKIQTVKKPKFFGDLLHLAGYEYLIADTREKQDSIKHFYRKGEVICTIGSDRYQHYHVVHAWKKNAKEILPESQPTRDGEYGTSVVSIQIAKRGGFISIKNRYNHTVSCCDNTLNSNPDNIINGLSASLKDHFNVDFSSKKEEISGRYHIYRNMILKYNFEISGVFVGETFYLKNGELHEINKDNEIVLDYFVLDLKTKKLLNPIGSEDAFLKAFEEEVANKKIVITKDENYQEQDGEFSIIKI